MARTSASSRLKVLLIVIALSGSLRQLNAERVFNVVEGPPSNQFVGRVQQSGGTNYGFTADSPYACRTNFTINSITSIIEAIGLLDREVIYMADQTDKITCFVTFILNGTNTIDREPVTIRILDINDEIPRFSGLSRPHYLPVVENLNVPAPVLTLQPRDYDSGVNGTVSFSIIDGNAANNFRIGPVEGDVSNSTKRIIYLQSTLVFNEKNAAANIFNLTINITDMGTPQLYQLQRINIAVRNTPDETPTFPTSSYMFDLPESQQLGPDNPFGNVTADNVNQVHGGTIFYSLSYDGDVDDANKFFVVKQDTGELYLNQSLDYEDMTIRSLFPYMFSVRAFNPGINGFQDARVTVILKDVNENPPLVTCSTMNNFPCPQENTNRLEHNIVENSVMFPYVVGHFTISSGDFSEATNNVTIVSNPQIGLTSTKFFDELIVNINQTLDREETPSITITITAYELVLSGTATIFIQVEDVNDNTPQFLLDTYQTQISDGTPIGKVITTVTALDADEGENGTVSYAITNYDKSVAESWFQISETTGEISVSSSEIDYNPVNGRVSLTVTATDNGVEPLSSSAIVTVDISPIVTFTPASYQEFKNLSVDVSSDSFSPIYIEFRTTQPNGLLLFQPGSNNDSFGLQLENGLVHCWFENGVDVCESEGSIVVNVHNNEWHSVSLQRNVESGNLVLSVWLTDFQEASRTTRLLTSSLTSCTNRETSHPSSLFIGGVDPFSISNINLTTTDYVGLVHNVLIGNTKIDLGCPSREENTVRGSHNSDSCDLQALSCDTIHTTGCVGHEPEPYCRCLGGFPHQACSISSSGSNSDDKNGYAPIRFYGNTRVDFTLDYSFFYDLELQRTQVGGVTREDIDVGPGPGKKRRRRQMAGTDSEPEETIQSVNISFRPVEVSNGVLLYSRTRSSVHLLKVMEAEAPTHTIIYMVSDPSGNQDPIYIPVNINLQNNTLYQASIKFTNKKVTLTVHSGLHQLTNADNWGSHDVTTFAEQPSTFMSIGGTDEDHLGFFVGCISSITINTIDLPLNGLLTAPEGGFIASSSSNGGGEGDDDRGVESNCNLCDLTNCSDDMQCVPSNLMGDTRCVCPTGHVFDDDENKCSSVIPPTGPLTEGKNGISIYVIIGAASGGVLVAGILIVLLIVIVRVVHIKREKRKRTYSVHSLNIAEMRSTTNQYEYVPQPRRDEPALTSLNGSCATSKRGSSVSTYQEHCEDADPEMDTPRRYSRRKSTTSAESGIKTDTDRDPSIRSREIPRMDDSGNERDTDYSPPESESDDLTSSCCMESALSPVGLQLVGSSNSLVGLSTNIRSPLTPQERKIITPLRPPSTNLSMSELDDVSRHNRELDTDAETEFFYPLPGVPYSPTRNGMPVVLSRPIRTNSDSDKTSRSSTPKWYKSSTASDTEREKDRIQSTRSYYTTHTSPPHKYPHNPAPEYRSPPAFSDRKSASPLNPNPRNRMMHTIDSPLARNTHKYENHPLPYLDLPVRDHRHEYDQVQPTAHPPQPMRYKQLGKPYASTMATRRQNSSDNHPRDYNHHMIAGTLPSHFRGGVANRSFSTGDAPPSDSEHHFQDLKSVSTINPISYWEMQDRMKAAVDQVDPYHVLSEPYVQFEDVSTSPSVTESQLTLEEPIGLEHQVFESQGGGEGAADINPIDDISLSRMQDNDLDSVMTESDIGQGIKHFPSADCSDEYTATLVATSSTSGESTPKLQPRNGFPIPLSQRSFDV